MTKKEKEKLIEAYNHFAKAIHEREYRTINVFGHERPKDVTYPYDQG